MSGEFLPLKLLVPNNGIEFISMNQTRTMHWSKLHKHQSAWKQATFVALHQAQFPHALPPCRIRSQFTFTMNRRRDPHNYFATLKPIVDQLVTYGCWPDDTAEYVSLSEPQLRVGPIPAVSLIFQELTDD